MAVIHTGSSCNEEKFCTDEVREISNSGYACNIHEDRCAMYSDGLYFGTSCVLAYAKQCEKENRLPESWYMYASMKPSDNKLYHEEDVRPLIKFLSDHDEKILLTPIQFLSVDDKKIFFVDVLVGLNKYYLTGYPLHRHYGYKWLERTCW